MKKSIYLLLILVICYSCGETVSFEDPQPTHISALNQIPQKYWGTYFDDGDSSTVKIDATSIVKNYIVELNDSFDEVFGELDEADQAKIVSQTDSEITVELIEGEFQTLAIKNDSLFGTINIPDILFAISQQDVVKHYKEHEYFNILNKDGDYYLRKVSFEDDVLVISKIKKVLDVKNLIAIEKTSETSGKGLSPTKRQFKKITQHSFNVDQILKRIE